MERRDERHERFACLLPQAYVPFQSSMHVTSFSAVLACSLFLKFLLFCLPVFVRTDRSDRCHSHHTRFSLCHLKILSITNCAGVPNVLFR